MPNSGEISTGVKLRRLVSLRGAYFHMGFMAIPRVGAPQKAPKSIDGVGKHGRVSVFLIFANLQIAAVGISTIFPNEAASTLNIPQIQL